MPRFRNKNKYKLAKTKEQNEKFHKRKFRLKTAFAFTKGQIDGRGKTLKLSGKDLFLGTLDRCEARNLLRLLNTLETIITTEFGSNVEV